MGCSRIMYFNSISGALRRNTSAHTGSKHSTSDSSNGKKKAPQTSTSIRATFEECLCVLGWMAALAEFFTCMAAPSSIIRYRVYTTAATYTLKTVTAALLISKMNLRRALRVLLSPSPSKARRARTRALASMVLGTPADGDYAEGKGGTALTQSLRRYSATIREFVYIYKNKMHVTGALLGGVIAFLMLFVPTLVSLFDVVNTIQGKGSLSSSTSTSSFMNSFITGSSGYRRSTVTLLAPSIVKAVILLVVTQVGLTDFSGRALALLRLQWSGDHQLDGTATSGSDTAHGAQGRMNSKWSSEGVVLRMWQRLCCVRSNRIISTTSPSSLGGNDSVNLRGSAGSPMESMASGPSSASVEAHDYGETASRAAIFAHIRGVVRAYVYVWVCVTFAMMLPASSYASTLLMMVAMACVFAVMAWRILSISDKSRSKVVEAIAIYTMKQRCVKHGESQTGIKDKGGTSGGGRGTVFSDSSPSSDARSARHANRTTEARSMETEPVVPRTSSSSRTYALREVPLSALFTRAMTWTSILLYCGLVDVIEILIESVIGGSIMRRVSAVFYFEQYASLTDTQLWYIYCVVFALTLLTHMLVLSRLVWGKKLPQVLVNLRRVLAYLIYKIFVISIITMFTKLFRCIRRGGTDAAATGGRVDAWIGEPRFVVIGTPDEYNKLFAIPCDGGMRHRTLFLLTAVYLGLFIAAAASYATSLGKVSRINRQRSMYIKIPSTEGSEFVFRICVSFIRSFLTFDTSYNIGLQLSPFVLTSGIAVGMAYAAYRCMPYLGPGSARPNTIEVNVYAAVAVSNVLLAVDVLLRSHATVGVWKLTILAPLYLIAEGVTARLAYKLAAKRAREFDLIDLARSVTAFETSNLASLEADGTLNDSLYCSSLILCGSAEFNSFARRRLEAVVASRSGGDKLRGHSTTTHKHDSSRAVDIGYLLIVMRRACPMTGLARNYIVQTYLDKLIELLHLNSTRGGVILPMNAYTDLVALVRSLLAHCSHSTLHELSCTYQILSVAIEAWNNEQLHVRNDDSTQDTRTTQTTTSTEEVGLQRRKRMSLLDSIAMLIEVVIRKQRGEHCIAYLPVHILHAAAKAAVALPTPADEGEHGLLAACDEKKDSTASGDASTCDSFGPTVERDTKSMAWLRRLVAEANVSTATDVFLARYARHASGVKRVSRSDQDGGNPDRVGTHVWILLVVQHKRLPPSTAGAGDPARIDVRALDASADPCTDALACSTYECPLPLRIVRVLRASDSTEKTPYTIHLPKLKAGGDGIMTNLGDSDEHKSVFGVDELAPPLEYDVSCEPPRRNDHKPPTTVKEGQALRRGQAQVAASIGSTMSDFGVLDEQVVHVVTSYGSSPAASRPGPFGSDARRSMVGRAMRLDHGAKFGSDARSSNSTSPPFDNIRFVNVKPPAPTSCGGGDAAAGKTGAISRLLNAAKRYISSEEARLDRVGVLRGQLRALHGGLSHRRLAAASVAVAVEDGGGAAEHDLNAVHARRPPGMVEDTCDVMLRCFVNMMQSVRDYDERVVRELVLRGLDPKSSKVFGMVPLILYTCSFKGAAEIVKGFLRDGCDARVKEITVSSSRGRGEQDDSSAGELASNEDASDGPVIQLLQWLGDTLYSNCSDSELRSKALFRLLADPSYEIRSLKLTALHIAAAKGQRELVEMLLARHVKVEQNPPEVTSMLATRGGGRDVPALDLPETSSSSHADAYAVVHGAHLYFDAPAAFAFANGHVDLGRLLLARQKDYAA